VINPSVCVYANLNHHYALLVGTLGWNDMPMLERSILITGGARSGKSSYALKLADKVPGRAFFVATAQPLDDEMRERIAHHRTARSARFQTVEEPIALSAAIRQLEGRADLVIVDCLTLWISNLLGATLPENVITDSVEELTETLRSVALRSIIVTGEVGSGIVPENPLARRFRDLLGWTNQRVAAVVDTVIMMVAGFPLRAK
jgi:adenosylcobinamide kinase/adenosylcobinamide-phosphate guanylyltransferase